VYILEVYILFIHSRQNTCRFVTTETHHMCYTYKRHIVINQKYTPHSFRRREPITNNTQHKNDEQFYHIPDRIHYSEMLHSHLSDIISPTKSSNALSSDLKQTPCLLAEKPNYKLEGYNIFTRRGERERVTHRSRKIVCSKAATLS
jgi:hypothetical protein